MTEAETIAKRALAMFAQAGSFHGVSINNILTSPRPHKHVRGKAGVVRAAVELAATTLCDEVDLLLPADASDQRRIADGVAELFGTLATSHRDEQTVVVMAWVELPAAGRQLADYENKGKMLQGAGEASDDYDRRLTERLVRVLRNAGVTESRQRGRDVAALVRAAHLAVARGRVDDVADYGDLAAVRVSPSS